MKNLSVNAEAITTVAGALGAMNSDVVYVGGAVVGAYATDPGAGDVRPTKDVDIALQIATEHELEEIRKKLIAKGFIQTAEENVMCRFRCRNVLVDVMSTREVGWAPANPWFAPGFHHAETVTIAETTVKILPLSYFLATKFSAYHERGKNDPRTSHDVEDIVYILDNRTDLVDQIQQSPADVKEFLKKEFAEMLNNDLFREAILGNLSYGTQAERFKMIVDKLKLIIG